VEGLATIAASRFCAPPWSFAARPSRWSDWAVTPWRGFWPRRSRTVFQQALESPRFGPDLSALLEQRRFKASRRFLTFTCWAGTGPVLIVDGARGGAGWRCRRSCAVPPCSDRQAAAAVKAPISASPCPATATRSKAAGPRHRRGGAAHPLCDQRFKSEVEPAVGAGLDQPCWGCRKSAQAVWMAWGRSAAAWSWPPGWWRRRPMWSRLRLGGHRRPRSPQPMALELKVLERADCEALAWALIWACPRLRVAAEVHPSHLPARYGQRL